MVQQALPLAILSLRLKQGQKPPEKIPPPRTVLEWARRFRRIEGRAFTLENFTPLQAIYEDEHPHIVIMKPAQRGISELAINYTMFGLECGAKQWADGKKDGLNIAYIFPTIDALGDFSKERMSGLEDESVHLAKLFGEHDDFNAVRFKQVGRSYLYLRGGWSTKALKSFPADVLVLDEFDEMEPRAIALARRRMNASIVRRELDLSTPGVPGHGIHAQFLQSDQHIYYQKHACGADVSYDFFRDVWVNGVPFAGDDGWKSYTGEMIRKATVELRCPSCSAPVDKTERCAPGKWVAQNPEITSIRGYHIPWWPFPFVNLVNFCVSAVSQDPMELEQFYQSDLGLPYGSGGARITLENLLALSAPLENGNLPDANWRTVTMGVDVGTRFHYRISADAPDGRVYVLAMGSVGGWDEVDNLMASYRVRLCVIDSMPEQHAAKAFVDRHRGRAVTAGYPANATSLKTSVFAPVRDKALEQGHVQINRTMAMDGVAALVHGGGEIWPSDITHNHEVQEQMMAPIRVVVIDETGQPKAGWVHTKPDHLFHASVYDTIARKVVVAEAASAATMPQKNTYHAERRRMI